MPFTGSHPAAVLPFLRTRLPPSALVIGAVAPDVPYYAPAPMTPHVTHTLLGAVSVDVAIAAVVFAAWQALVGPALVAYAPAALRVRLDRPVPAGLRAHCASPARALLALTAFAVGSVTHVGWDAFTHDGEWGAAHLAWLAARYGPLPGYEWAQYASGLAGVAAIAWWCLRWWRRRSPVDPGPAPLPPGAPPVAAAWCLVGVCAVAGTAYGWWYGLGRDNPVRSAFFFAAVRGLGAGALAVLALALGWAWRRCGRSALRTLRRPRRADAGSRAGSADDDQVGAAGRR
jgi:uncharacterized protein DUF4184